MSINNQYQVRLHGRVRVYSEESTAALLGSHPFATHGTIVLLVAGPGLLEISFSGASPSDSLEF